MWLLRNPLLAAAAAALAALGLWAGWLDWQLGRSRLDLAEVRQAWSQDKAQAALAAMVESEKYRAMEQQWAQAQKEISDDADRKIVAARADAAIADASAGRLQQRIAALVAEARSASANTAAPQGSPPAADPVNLLANVLQRSDAIAGQLADYADQARIAGEACQSAYEALTP